METKDCLPNVSYCVIIKIMYSKEYKVKISLICLYGRGIQRFQHLITRCNSVVFPRSSLHYEGMVRKYSDRSCLQQNKGWFTTQFRKLN